MKIISWNVNGLRSVVKRGVLEWISKESPDILCFQEIKMQESDIPFDLVYLDDYNSDFNSSRKKGRGGVAIYSKQKPASTNRMLGLERFDEEGRFLELKFPDFTLINVYLPHGGRDKHDLDYKLVVYHQLLLYLKEKGNEDVILLGDFNIAHEESDLARPEGNRDNIMFSPAERFQIDRLIHLGFIDSFRMFNEKPGYYSWWSYMRNARERNLGWRIDYVFISDDLAPRLKDAFILKDISYGSDHSPIGIEIF
jgi:exodeoxyribonuclease-3